MNAQTVVLVVLFCLYTLGCWLYSTTGEDEDEKDK